jgi:hypothetical protein
VGAGLLVDFSLRRKYGSAAGKTSSAANAGESVKKHRIYSQPKGAMARLSVFMNHMDYRLLIVGAMLPDLIDKPLGHIFFADFFNNQGRLFAHSLLFLIIIILTGLCLYRRWKQRWLLILSFGTAVHLITDEMWQNPHTALWPFLGWSFGKNYAGGDWWGDLWHSFTEASPYVIATETIGVVLIVIFLIILIRRKKLWAFVRYGRL